MEIKVVKKVLDVNDAIAREIRELLLKRKIFMLNIMSSPGSGKTTLLEKVLGQLKKSDITAGIIVGDICTTNDSERLSRFGQPVVQINTEPFGGDCHLSANVVREAIKELPLDRIQLLIVENVGNLVCPAEFDIGADKSAVILSITEGEDKPLKYPLMFRVANLAIINKIDLLPYLDFRKELVLKNIKQINPEIEVFELSAKTEEGVNKFIDWIKTQVKEKSKG